MARSFQTTHQDSGTNQRERMISILCLIFLLAFSEGSRIVLEHTPDVVAESITDTLTLTCFLEDTATVFIGGRKRREIGSETTFNPDQVTSIEITRDGETIASLVSGGFPIAFADHGNLRVIGDLRLPASAGNKSAFLELTWTSPGLNQSGGYECVINTTFSYPPEKVNTTTTYSVLSEIGVMPPTTDDLLKKIGQLEEENKSNKQRLAALEAAASTLTPAHSESGTISCGSSSGWNTYENSHRFKYVNVNFKTSYGSRTPVVNIGISSIDVDEDKNMRIHAEVVSVSKTGFRARCGTWGDSKIHAMTLRWSSVVA